MTHPLMNRTGINRTLTGREVEMLHWIMTGKSDWEIAAILSMSKKTVNYHVEKVKKKLGSPNRITAVAVALRDGLISFPANVAPAETERMSSACQTPLGHAPDVDRDAGHALPWVFTSCHICDDPNSGPRPALAPFAY